MQSQLKHGGQSGKRIGHLILLPRNMVEGYVIEELFQLLDGGLVGYQLMIPSLPFSP